MSPCCPLHHVLSVVNCSQRLWSATFWCMLTGSDVKLQRLMPVPGFYQSPQKTCLSALKPQACGTSLQRVEDSLLTEGLLRCRILEQLATSPQPRYWVSGHDDDGQCATRYARPAEPESQAADMETRMAKEFPPLPSQLFGSPAQNTLPYFSAIKASQQGVGRARAAVMLHAPCVISIIFP